MSDVIEGTLCPICKGTGKVKEPGFKDHTKMIERSCSVCKSKGRLEPHVEDLIKEIIKLRSLVKKYIRRFKEIT